MPVNTTSAPSRAAATAWFAPLPPGKRSNVAPETVSPGRGSRSQRATRSRLTDPTTAIAGGASRSERCADPRRSVEEVLAKIEESCPERVPVGRSIPTRARSASPSSARTSTASSRYACATRCGDGLNAGPGQHGVPFDKLRRPRLAVPGAPFGGVRLELEQIARERLFEARDCGLRPVRGALQRRLPPARRGRLGVSARPALEQAAERQSRHLAGAELCRPGADRSPARPRGG